VLARISSNPSAKAATTPWNNVSKRDPLVKGKTAAPATALTPRIFVLLIEPDEPVEDIIIYANLSARIIS